MPSQEYDKNRALAIKINGQFPADHPCTKGKAECCEGNVAMVSGDIDLLLAGVNSGAVSLEVVSKAVANSKIPDNKWCPFLDLTDRTCMLRVGDKTYQPLQCIYYGQGGRPLDTVEFRQAQARYRNRVDSLVSYRGIRPMACTSCLGQLKESGACVKYSILDGVKRLYNYQADEVYGKKPYTSTNKFVEDYLAPKV